MNRALFKSALLIPAPAAKAAIGDIRWSGDGRFAPKTTSAIGKFAELCEKLPTGLKEGWEIQAANLSSTQQRR